MKNIVFICGAERSGTSLLHLMLDHHPYVTNPGEFDFLFDQVTGDGVFPGITSYHDWLSIHRIFQSKSLSIDNSLAYPDLINSFISQQIQPDKILALNIHRGFDRIPFLYPDVKFIHLIRDPRDVARSCIGMGWAGNVYYGIERWLQTERSWQRLQEKILPEQYIEIRFEDLILSPEAVLNDICSFMGITYTGEMFNYVNESTYNKPDPSLVWQWKTKLSIREIQYVELRAHGLMAELGYDLSNPTLISIGVIERFWLKICNKVYKIQFTLKQYGFSLYFKERFSRWFNLKSINKQAQLAMNEIDRLHLK